MIFIIGLSELPIGDKRLTVRVAERPQVNTHGINPFDQPQVPQISIQPQLAIQYDHLSNQIPTKVLRLENMITQDDLQDDEEYEDILNDVREECNSFGKVIKIIIPRIKDGYPADTEGYIYVLFDDINGSNNAAKNLQGRKFADRIVMVNYVSLCDFL